MLVALFVVETMNLLVYIYASVLLFQEYERKVSEAWYSHKLLIWANLVFNCVHLAVFWPLYSETLALLALAKCVTLSLIAAAQFMTRPGANSFSNWQTGITCSAGNRIEILRSTSDIDANDIK